MAQDKNVIDETVVATTTNNILEAVKPMYPYAIGAAAVIAVQLLVKGVRQLVASSDQTFEEVVDSALAVANEA